MEKFIISEEEKSRILEMHETATNRYYLNENTVITEAEWYNAVGSVIGIFDPTGLVDFINGISYLSQGDMFFGLLSMISVVPYIGDAAKYLIEQKVLDSISLDTEIKLAPQNLNSVPEQIISTTAVAPFAKSVSEFWIQIQPETVTAIMERIDRLTQDPNFANKKEFIASIGKPCLAFLCRRWTMASGSS